MTNDAPQPGISTPGSGAEQRDDNVWGGAESSDSGAIIGESESDAGVAVGSDADEPLFTGRASTSDLPPNRALPGSGSEQRDDNVWYGGRQPLD
jgi:hypothetical protein